MILNELSIFMDSEKEDVIRTKLSRFLRVCQKLQHEKRDNEFYYTRELMEGKISQIYSIHDWLKDPKVAHSEKTFFRSLINRGKLFDQSMFLECEMKIDTNDNETVSAQGCLAAFEWNSYVVSIVSAELWKNEWIDGTYLSLECEEKKVQVRNCSQPEHVDSVISEEKRANRLLISSGSELWEKREELYPHLRFCMDVRKQLEEARVSLQVQNIMKRIQILEDYFAEYDGDFHKERVGHGCRFESDSVQNDTYLRNLRRFMTPYGKEEYFYWHISFPGNYPGRIHFLPDPEHKVGIIGYVGMHLPTSRFRTF